MQLYLFFCDDCFSRLKEMDEKASIVYQDICYYFSSNKKALRFHPCDYKYVRIVEFLEKMGYVTSTWVMYPEIYIKPNGHKELDKDSHGFCKCSTCQFL